MPEYESSAIKSASYDQAKQELEIEFRNGGTYRYLGVPPEEAEAFAASSSKGGHFQAYIRNNYTAVHLPTEDVESFPFPEPVLPSAADLDAVVSEREPDNLRQYATIFRDIFLKSMDVSPEGRMNMAVAQLRALGVK